ncbi:hypothetical protein [Flavobacterium yafengii]|uniref:hypothetical protein n=1 Tax=Flavobacterium yafengii TaxID=3041253 RepID=UPI0024A7E9C9|nr:hypothetical protein [Flavobacterium yafengii]MDI5898955.1 hypothetical protein [Flavobacterium yafengii]
MKLNLKAYTKFGEDYSLSIGEMIVKKNEIVNFKEDHNCEFYKFNYNGIFPIKRSTYTAIFLDEYHDNYKSFQASIQIKDSFLVFVKLNCIQKLKLKWMLKSYTIQSEDMKKELLKYFIGGAFGIFFTILTQEVTNRYKAEPVIPPNAGIKKYFDNKKDNSLRKNSIIISK